MDVEEKPAPAQTSSWTEKYRPKTIDDVSHQEEVVSMLKSCLDSGSLPHLLFYGPPGTGKTTTILAIAKDMFGDLYKKRVLELNASDERGISVVRDKIKGFAKGSVGTNASVPPFKLIILDEADAMTQDAQSAMRRTMEEYSTVTRFCLICNYVSRIIEPLASRCAKFRFQPLPQAAIVARLNFICEKEGLQCSEDVANTVCDVSGGDMRKAITYVQGATRLCEGNVTVQAVLDMAGAVPPDSMTELFSALRVDDYNQMESLVDDLILAAYPINAILAKLLDLIVADEDISDLHKAKTAVKIAEVEKLLVDGASERLQLLHVCSYIQCVHCGKKPLPGEVG